MAQKVKIMMEDDLDGSAAEETVRFGLDGGQYEIDLNSAHAQQLREAVRPFANKARRVKPAKSQRGQGQNPARNPETARIRQWAKENNYDVPDRGRLRPEIKDAFYAANSDSAK